ncbi:MAG: hypothetical protein CMB56_002490 [Methanobacteriota archaeon]|nr:MAG: hypothetical protein CMB56_002490 [Euryarchaeota archaeon]|tara:strand:- start:3835 stop:4179 length:345 start_codon:yes stop_codon:yes gene_type:complete
MIDHLLKIISNDSDIISGGVFDEDGLLLYSFGNKNIINKVSNTMQKIIHENHQQFYSLSIEPVNCLTLIGDKGTSIFWPMKKSSSLAIVINSKSNLGKIRKDIRKILPRIEELI